MDILKSKQGHHCRNEGKRQNAFGSTPQRKKVLY